MSASSFAPSSGPAASRVRLGPRSNRYRADSRLILSLALSRLDADGRVPHL